MSMRSLATKFGIGAGAAAVSLVALSGVAEAATISAYLSWGGIISGACAANTYKQISVANYDPNVHSKTWAIDVLQNGYFEDIVYNQDGVRTAARWYGCAAGRLHDDYLPTVYNHRTITQHWYCYGGSCLPLTATTYGAWKSGVYTG